MRQKSKAKGKRILGVVLALVFLISCIMTPDVHAQAESMIIALSARSVKIGDTLAVTVTLPAGVTGTVNLTYSKDLFTYQSATAETSVNAGTVSMTLGSYGSGNKRASGTVKFKADAAGTASFAASAPSAGNQEGDRVDVGGASVSVAVENSAAAADDKSKDNTLASLTISEGTLSPEFQSKVTEYQAKVGDQVTSLAVSAQPNDAKASVISVSGADKLKTGVNKVQIVVQAENGVKKTYTIQVTRGAAQQESQDTQQKGETQAPADGQQYFTIDGTNLYLTDSIPDRYVLDGFVKDTVTLWENQYPCMRKDGIDTPLRLLYLVDENGQNGALYMLDLDDPEEIYPFVCMNYNQYKHTIGEETTSAEASTQEGETSLFQSTESQMRLILCGIRYPRGRGVLTDWQCDFEAIEVGKGQLLKEGKDIALLSLGPIGNTAAEAIRLFEQQQAQEGHPLTVAHYDMRFLKPLDENILYEVGTHFSRIITIEDGVVRGGLGSAVLEYMSDHGFFPKVTRMGLPDYFVEHGTVEQLRQIVGIDRDAIVSQLRSISQK